MFVISLGKLETSGILAGGRTTDEQSVTDMVEMKPQPSLTYSQQILSVKPVSTIWESDPSSLTAAPESPSIEQMKPTMFHQKGEIKKGEIIRINQLEKTSRVVLTGSSNTQKPNAIKKYNQASRGIRSVASKTSKSDTKQYSTTKQPHSSFQNNLSTLDILISTKYFQTNKIKTTSTITSTLPIQTNVGTVIESNTEIPQNLKPKKPEKEAGTTGKPLEAEVLSGTPSAQVIISEGKVEVPFTSETASVTIGDSETLHSTTNVQKPSASGYVSETPVITAASVDVIQGSMASTEWEHKTTTYGFAPNVVMVVSTVVSTSIVRGHRSLFGSKGVTQEMMSTSGTEREIPTIDVHMPDMESQVMTSIEKGILLDSAPETVSLESDGTSEVEPIKQDTTSIASSETYQTETYDESINVGTSGSDTSSVVEMSTKATTALVIYNIFKNMNLFEIYIF